MKKQIIFLSIAAVYAGHSATWGFTGDVYTATEDFISRVRHFEDTEGETIFDVIGRSSPVAALGETVYWINQKARTINRMDTEVSAPAEVLLTRSITPDKLKVDPVEQKLYWFEEQTIMRANIDGTGVEPIITIDGFIEDFAFSPNGDKLFWLDIETGNIMSADMDGSNIQDITPTGLPEYDNRMMSFSSITASSDHVYFSCFGYGYGQIVYKMPQQGGAVESHIYSYEFKVGLYFHAKEDTLYWLRTPSIYGDYGIENHYGPSIDLKYASTSDVIKFFVSWGEDRPILWWSDSYGIHKKLLSYVKKLAVITDIMTCMKANFTDDEIGGWIYWAEMKDCYMPEPSGCFSGTGNIYRVTIDGTSRETVLSGLNSVSGILFDSIHGHLYWADFLAETIYRTIPGSETVEMVVDNVGFPFDLAYDSANNTLYWSDYYTGICSFNLSTQSKRFIKATHDALTPIALDTTTQTLYFHDYYDQLTKIKTDGTEYERMGINFNCYTNIVFDANDHALYWLCNELRYVNLAGTPSIEGIGVLRGEWLALDVRIPALTILGRSTVHVGSSVTLNTGVLPPLAGQVTYSWFKDGVLIDGANSPSYTIHAIVEEDAGEYYVVVTDEINRTYTSRPFTLTVLEGKLPLDRVVLVGVFLLTVVAFFGLHLPRQLCRRNGNDY